MPRHNSSGPSSSGRRGSSRRNSSDDSSSGRGRSSGKPFKKSDSGKSDRSSSAGKGGKRTSFGAKREGFSKGPRDEKPFKKFDRRGDSDRSEGRKDFNKSDKPFRKRDGDQGSDNRSFRSRRDSGDSFSDRRKKSFGDRDEKRSFRDRKDSSEGRSGDKPERKSFGKRDEGRPFRDKKTSGSFRDRKGPSEGRFSDKSEGKSFGDRDERRSFRDRKGSSDRFKDKSEGKSFSGRGDRKENSDKEERGFFRKSKSRYSDKREKNYADEPAPAQTEKIRLNRYIANSGVCSRREADELIGMGLVSVNGKTITEMGYKVNPGDEVRYENKVLKAEKPVYILLNKPKGYLTTTDDPQDRNTVMQIIGSAVKERIYPVGRLDRNTTGLLLLTNDGDLAEKLMHPSYNIKKIYKVELDRPLTKADFQTIQEGVQLEEGRAMVDDIAIISEDGRTVGLELHIGWNRVVRRIFETLQYQVVKLDRSVYAGLDKKDLGRGEWRFLTKEELIRLKHYK